MPHPPLSAHEQAALDHRYWCTDDPAAEIARSFGLGGTNVARYVTPEPSDDRCLLCGGTGLATSRTARSRGWLRCADCRASLPTSEVLNRLTRTSARWWGSDAEGAEHHVDHVVVRPDGPRVDLGRSVASLIASLAALGYRFDDTGSVDVLRPSDGIDQIQAVLARSRVGTIGVESLTTLGVTQTEALANLWLLTHDGWRVVSASGTSAWSRDAGEEWVDDVIDAPGRESLGWTSRSSPERWSQTGFGGAHDEDERALIDDTVIDASSRFGRHW